MPLTSPAVAASTFCAAGVAAGDEGSADLLLFRPPHARRRRERNAEQTDPSVS